MRIATTALQSTLPSLVAAPDLQASFRPTPLCSLPFLMPPIQASFRRDVTRIAPLPLQQALTRMLTELDGKLQEVGQKLLAWLHQFHQGFPLEGSLPAWLAHGTDSLTHVREDVLDVWHCGIETSDTLCQALTVGSIATFRLS